jgi:hypothetical protein
MASKKWATVSTTSLVRQAGERAAWDVAAATAILRAWSFDHPNAMSAIRVIQQRSAGAVTFAIERSGAIVGIAA